VQNFASPNFPCIFDATVHLTSSDGSFIETLDRLLKSNLGPPVSNPRCQNLPDYEPPSRHRTATQRVAPSAQSHRHRRFCRNPSPAPNCPRPGWLTHQLDHPPPLRLRPARGRTAQFANSRFFPHPGPAILKGLKSFSPALADPIGLRWGRRSPIQINSEKVGSALDHKCRQGASLETSLMVGMNRPFDSTLSELISHLARSYPA